jgi:Acetyltransferase (GNAT) domain
LSLWRYTKRVAHSLAFCQHWSMVRLDALDPASPGLSPLLARAQRGGLVALRFDHFGNWYEPVSGLSWANYLAARAGSLRETIRRKLGRAEADTAISFELVLDSADIERAIDMFEIVYGRSWRPPEPFPRFNACVIREAASAGVLRLGILRWAGQPVAVQFCR